MGTMGEPVLKLATVKCFKMGWSSRLSRLSPNNKDPELEPKDNSSSMSSSDSKAELENGIVFLKVSPWSALANVIAGLVYSEIGTDVLRTLCKMTVSVKGPNTRKKWQWKEPDTKMKDPDTKKKLQIR
ncbi:hypothetical protein Tco_0385013 [Tanacetum coccineum]